MMREDKQAICDAFLATLLLTSAAGHPSDNKLKELRYIPEAEKVRPIFEDGTGMDGYYDINIACDSGIAMIMDITKQFIQKMW